MYEFIRITDGAREEARSRVTIGNYEWRLAYAVTQGLRQNPDENGAVRDAPKTSQGSHTLLVLSRISGASCRAPLGRLRASGQGAPPGVGYVLPARPRRYPLSGGSVRSLLQLQTQLRSPLTTQTAIRSPQSGV